MKNPLKVLTALAATATLALGLTACGGTSQATSDTITYWASDQGNSLDDTAAKLKPSLERFTKETGVKVQLEVISWTDLYNRQRRRSRRPEHRQHLGRDPSGNRRLRTG